ncbi:MAG: hypothetical protein EA367_12605 [Leptolyngbya sp. DLM2.Bin15]|nr:MAG: hypothetical protein EA367_12605 [Leptolyngbya sp. DLM2.Bin15]
MPTVVAAAADGSGVADPARDATMGESDGPQTVVAGAIAAGGAQGAEAAPDDSADPWGAGLGVDNSEFSGDRVS